MNDVFETTGKLNGIILTATVTQIGINFDWTPSDHPLGYRIFRAEAPGDDGVSISDHPLTASGFFDANVEPNTWYYYTIAEVISEAGYDPESEPEITGQRSEELAIILSFFEPDSGKRGFIMMTIGDPFMQMNGELIEIDPGRGTAPLYIDGRTMMPIRAIVEGMGGYVDWDDADRRITLQHGRHTVHMWLGRREFLADGISEEMDIAPYVYNDRTMLPLRFVTESLGCQTEWIGSLNRMIIVYAMPEEEGSAELQINMEAG
jgi:hypothetical protein